MTWWYVSTRRWTVAVHAENEKPFLVVEAPPLARWAVGRPLRDLIRRARVDPKWQLIAYREEEVE